MKLDCRYSQTTGRRARAFALAVMLAWAVVATASVSYAAPQHDAPAGAGVTKEEAHETPLQTVAKLANFAILVGVLVYFLKTPVTAYLTGRRAQIRQDLVTAAETAATATTQLAEIERKLLTLPAEIEALKAQGAEDLRAEQARIAEAAVLERERLLQQTRREIEMRLRVARRELTELAAELAVSVAGQRIERTITPEDQLRLVDRYTGQLQAGAAPISGPTSGKDAR